VNLKKTAPLLFPFTTCPAGGDREEEEEGRKKMVLAIHIFEGIRGEAHPSHISFCRSVKLKRSTKRKRGKDVQSDTLSFRRQGKEMADTS